MPNAEVNSSIPQGHDRAARRLFGHPKVVADLLRGFAPEGPVREFDTASLSPRPDDRVDERLQRWQSDLTWTLKLRGGARVELIIEAQSTGDPAMAARMAVQVAMLCEQHMRSTPHEPLPGVLPVVFYTGRDRWRTGRSLRESSVAESVGLLTYFAPACYFLIEAWQVPLATLPKRNRVSLMVRMMRAEDDVELMAVLRSEQAWLAKEDHGLWRDYITWATRVLAPLSFPDMDAEQLQSLQEGIDMINEGVVRRLEASRQEGLAEGRSEGLSEGLAKGQQTLLEQQVVWKFGEATAKRFTRELSGAGDNGRMEELGRLIIDCRTGDEFLSRL